MRALFRCDASAWIGTGHVMRCLTFADTLRWVGWQCAFLTNPEARDIGPRLEGVGLVDTIDACDLAIVDHYGLDAAYERPLAERGARVVVFDDLADRRHDCSILVDPTPQLREEAYRDKVNKTARLLLGPRYAMIAETWTSRRSAMRSRLANAGRVERLFVSMGGTDPNNATARVLTALTAAQVNAHIDIVLGPQAPHRHEIATLQNERITLHVGHPDVAALAARADLAIGAAGTSSFERAVLGLPSIMISLADNQRHIAAAFAEAKAAEVLPAEFLVDMRAFGDRIAALARDPERRKAMSCRAAALTDGRGRLRLVAAIAGEAVSRSGHSVTLRLAEAEDEAWLLDLQRQDGTRRFARNPAVPSATEHAAWFAAVLQDRARLPLVIVADEAPCGTLRLDRLPGEKPVFEISIAVDGRCHGRGIGRAALALARRLAPGADLVAMVKPENAPSIALFAGAGYTAEGGCIYKCRTA